jgi:hypothetical protein
MIDLWTNFNTNIGETYTAVSPENRRHQVLKGIIQEI